MKIRRKKKLKMGRIDLLHIIIQKRVLTRVGTWTNLVDIRTLRPEVYVIIQTLLR